MQRVGWENRYQVPGLHSEYEAVVVQEMGVVVQYATWGWVWFGRIYTYILQEAPRQTQLCSDDLLAFCIFGLYRRTKRHKDGWNNLSLRVMAEWFLLWAANQTDGFCFPWVTCDE